MIFTISSPIDKFCAKISAQVTSYSSSACLVEWDEPEYILKNDYTRTYPRNGQDIEGLGH